MKHTLGPWNRGYGNYIYQGEETGKGRLIAICKPSTRTQEDWDQVWANAQLISQSPKMLEILQKLVSSGCITNPILEDEAEFVIQGAIRRA